MLPKEESLVEYLYPIFNWKNIWKNYMSLFIYSIDKEIMYKYRHICHATNKNLYTMKLIKLSGFHNVLLCKVNKYNINQDTRFIISGLQK